MVNKSYEQRVSEASVPVGDLNDSGGSILGERFDILKLGASTYFYRMPGKQVDREKIYQMLTGKKYAGRVIKLTGHDAIDRVVREIEETRGRFSFK